SWRAGIGLRRAKSLYVRLPRVAFCSSTKWQARQFMLCPANGPGNVPEVVTVVSITGSPSASTALALLAECAKKNCAKRVSRNNRSPIVCSGGSVAWPRAASAEIIPMAQTINGTKSSMRGTAVFLFMGFDDINDRKIALQRQGDANGGLRFVVGELS